MKKTMDARLSPAEAARMLGVSVDRVRAWCESGRITSYRSMHNWRMIDRNELITFARKYPNLVAPPRQPFGDRITKRADVT